MRSYLTTLADVTTLAKSCGGTSAIEYAIIASLISVAAAGVLLSVGTSVSALFSRVASGF